MSKSTKNKAKGAKSDTEKQIFQKELTEETVNEQPKKGKDTKDGGESSSNSDDDDAIEKRNDSVQSSHVRSSDGEGVSTNVHKSEAVPKSNADSTADVSKTTGKGKKASGTTTQRIEIITELLKVANADDVGENFTNVLMKRLKEMSEGVTDKFVDKAFSTTEIKVYSDDPNKDSLFEIKLLDVTVTTERKAYVEYTAKRIAYDSNYEVSNKLPEDMVKATQETFKYGTVLVSMQFTDELLKQAHAQQIEGVAYIGENLFKRSDFSPENPSKLNHYHVAGGILTLLRAVMGDTDVWAFNKLYKPDAPYENLGDAKTLIKSAYLKEPMRANPALLALMAEPPKWLKREMHENVIQGDNKDTYFLGEMSAQLGTHIGGKKTIQHATNIDMFKASVLNGNFCTLIEKSASKDNLAARAAANVFDNYRVSPPSLNEYALLDRKDGEHGIRVLMLQLIMNRDFVDLIHSMNIAFMMKTGVVTLSDNWSLIPAAMRQDVDFKDLHDFMKNLYYKSELVDIYQMFSREMAPTNHLFYLVENRVNMKTPYAIFYILQFVGFALLWPRLFSALSGQIADIILDFFREYDAKSYAKFIKQYGRKYTIGPRGAKQWSRKDERWDQSVDVLSENYPSLFASHNFSDVGAIGEVAELMFPQGILKPDRRAMEAEFPRFSPNPTHYHPYIISDYRNANTLDDRFKNAIELLKKLANDYMRKWRHIKSAGRSLFDSYLAHVETRFANLSKLLTTHMAFVLDALANQRQNFMPNYSGDLSTDKPIQVCLQSTDDPQVNLLLPIRTQGEKSNEINTAIFWSMLYGIDGPVLRNIGVGVDNIKMTAPLIIPDPKPEEALGMNFMWTVEQSTKSYGMLLLLAGGGTTFAYERYLIEGSMQFTHILPTLTWRNKFRDVNDDIKIRHVTQDDDVLTLQAAHERGARIFVVDYAGIDDDIKEWLVETEGLYITTSFIRGNLGGFFSTENVRIVRQGNTPTTVNLMLGIDDASVLEDCIALIRRLLPEIQQSTLMHILDYFSSKMDPAAETEFGKHIIDYNGAVKDRRLLRDPQIRRVDLNNQILPFNADVDNPAFENSQYFLPMEDLKRLTIGARMLDNERFKPHKGVRLVRNPIRKTLPEDYYPVPEGLRQIVYRANTTLFSESRPRGEQPEIEFDDKNDPTTKTVIGEDWQRIHLILNQDVELFALDIAGICKGIEEAKWIVDLPNLSFIAKINFGYVKQTEVTLRSLLGGLPDDVHVLTFEDMTPRMGGGSGELAIVQSRIKYIYPLNNIMTRYSAMELVDNHGIRPERARVPHAHEYTTGKTDASGAVLYKNGRNKLTDSVISQTNVINLLSADMRTTFSAPLIFKGPRSIDDFISP